MKPFFFNIFYLFIHNSKNISLFKFKRFFRKKINTACLIQAQIINIEKSHTQTTRPGTTTCRPYKYLFRTGIEAATHSAAADRVLREKI